MTVYKPKLLMNKKVNVNKIEAQLKMENLTRSFRETNCVLQLASQSHIKNKTNVFELPKERNECIFCKFYFVVRKFFQRLYFISMYICTYQKNIYRFLLVLKIVECLHFDLKSEAYSEPCQTYKRERFAEVKPVNYFRQIVHFRCLSGF